MLPHTIYGMVSFCQYQKLRIRLFEECSVPFRFEADFSVFCPPNIPPQEVVKSQRKT